MKRERERERERERRGEEACGYTRGDEEKGRAFAPEELRVRPSRGKLKRKKVRWDERKRETHTYIYKLLS